ncbi:MAG TPA: mannose-1-phosphate guanylyltransferase [Clostridiaceae bacterium]
MFYALIMAGGKGERLFPLSREERPKQFLKLIENKSFLRMTVERIKPLIGENIYVITNKKYIEQIYGELPDLSKENIFTEPLNKETATCLGLSAVKLLKKDLDALMISLPSDLYIKDVESLRKQIEIGANYAEENKVIVTFGIEPASPETGYGYIKLGEEVVKENSLFKVERFTEKPKEDTAKEFIRSKRYLWNSGIFILRADVLLAEINKHIPKLYDSLMKIYDSLNTEDEQRVIDEEYNKIEGISIDYGVMQKTKLAYVIKARFDWNDIGSFNSLSKYFNLVDNNEIKGKAFLEECNSCTVMSSDKIIVGFGLKKLIIIDAGDVLLIMDKEKEKDMKKLVEKIKNGSSFL